MPSSRISQILQMVRGIKDPDGMFDSLMQNNPQFRDFVAANRGKTPEQIAQENGIDLSIINMIKSGRF